MSNELDAERGRLAQEVMDNPVYADAYAQIEQEILTKWRESRDKDEREQLHQLLLMLAKVQKTLEAVMRSGKLSSAELIRRASLPERIGRALRRF